MNGSRDNPELSAHPANDPRRWELDQMELGTRVAAALDEPQQTLRETRKAGGCTQR